jgi:mycothiol synthase
MWHVETRIELDEPDRDDVQRLVETVARYDGYRPLSDHVWLDLVQGGREGYAAVLGRDQDGRLAGYAQLSSGHQSWGIELLVHPDHRHHSDDLAVALMSQTLDVVRTAGGGHVHWWTFRPDQHIDAVAAAVGLTPGRRLLQMRRALPLEPALVGDATLATRPFVVGRDEQQWLEVNNAAFHWHPEQGGWDLETLLQREATSWFDASGFLLHERDGRLAGFCWTKVHADTRPPMGEIYVIAVHPDFHGLGLGRALTTAGLQSLAARGLTLGMLYVDADNTAAVSLYDHLGFSVHHVDRAYVGNLEPATGGNRQ